MVYRRTFKVIFILTFLVSCSSSTLKSSIVNSALTGCAIGGIGGYSLSPDGRNNQRANAVFWCGVSGVVSGAIGYMLYKDNPMNESLKEKRESDEYFDSLSKEAERASIIKAGGTTISVKPNLENLKKIQFSEEDLPAHIRSKIPKSEVIYGKVEEQRIHDDGKTIIVPSHDIIIYQSGSSNGE